MASWAELQSIQSNYAGHVVAESRMTAYRRVWRRRGRNSRSTAGRPIRYTGTAKRLRQSRCQVYPMAAYPSVTLGATSGRKQGENERLSHV